MFHKNSSYRNKKKAPVLGKKGLYWGFSDFDFSEKSL